jgi:hypothetical protein
MSSDRVSAFEIAVAIRSAKFAMRPSAAAGSGPAVDDDGNADGRDHAQLSGDVRGRVPVRDRRVVVDSQRPARAQQRREKAGIVGREGPPPAEVRGELARGGDDRGGSIGLVADEPDEWHPEQPGDLGGDRGEHVARRDGPGDERRDAAERGLLRRESFQLVARLGIGDRRRDEFRERSDALLRARGYRLRSEGAAGHQSPDPSLDENRSPDRRPQPE